MRRSSALVLAASLSAAHASSQTYDDLTLVRNRPPEFASVFELRAGVAGAFPDDENPALNFEDEYGFDGHVYYRNGKFSSLEGQVDLYAGRDGAYLNLGEAKPDGTNTRLELTTRYSQFYREGFYQGDDFIPTFQYDAEDYGIYFGYGSAAAEGLYVEVGPYLRFNQFERSDDTIAGGGLPDDYVALGGRVFAEHNTLQLDRSTGRPAAGFILTLRIETEWNDSDRFFGTPSFMSRLPDTIYRGRAHLEWYIPQGGLGAWVLRADGQLADEDDRVNNADAWKPIGHTWVDASLGLRLDIGGLSLEPYFNYQYIRNLTEDGAGTDDNSFLGGGAHLRWDFADSFSFYADYSYSENASRTPVSLSQDTLGEHQLFAGFELRLGAERL